MYEFNFVIEITQANLNYLGFLGRIRCIAEVAGSSGKTPMSLHKFVIWDTAHYRESKAHLLR